MPIARCGGPGDFVSRGCASCPRRLIVINPQKGFQLHLFFSSIPRLSQLHAALCAWLSSPSLKPSRPPCCPVRLECPTVWPLWLSSLGSRGTGAVAGLWCCSMGSCRAPVPGTRSEVAHGLELGSGLCPHLEESGLLCRRVSAEWGYWQPKRHLP